MSAIYTTLVLLLCCAVFGFTLVLCTLIVVALAVGLEGYSWK